MVDRQDTGSTTEGLPIAPSLAPVLNVEHVSARPSLVDRRVVMVSGLACVVAVVSAAVAQLLTSLIGLFTNLAFYGRLSTSFVSPAGHHLGPLVVGVPVLGGLVVGLLARFGSQAIRGHGIPEAMEQVLTNESRIPARMTFLKPLSSAIAIGTGGPFGAEGPIIATGGALGSLLGQLLHVTAIERKTLLAAGAAAGMAATFGSPVSAVLLAIELLLFEYRPRSLIPVSLAAASAAGVRVAFLGSAPIFAMPEIAQPTGSALCAYVVMGAVVGLASVVVTRLVYLVEDGFAHLPVHWMWWPAIGGVAVGVVGYFAPRTLGVGYDNIEQIISGSMALRAIAFLSALKFLSWVVSLGSGTSGGTLAPLFTFGGGLGAGLGALVMALAPSLGVDTRIAALVGMAAMFAGASRALLASVVFAFETTRQPMGLLPLLGGCAAAFLVSCLLMRHSIMTEKIARRGVRVMSEYAADFLEQIHVRDCAARRVVTLGADDAISTARSWLLSDAAGSTHQAFPVLDADGALIGVLTRSEILAAGAGAPNRLRDLVRKSPIVIYDDCSLRDAADVMARYSIGRLPVVKRSAPRALLGIVTRSDLVNAHRRRLSEHQLNDR